MASGHRPRLLFALLLLWQLNAAVAMPHIGTPHGGSAPATHCAEHAQSMPGGADAPVGAPAPAAPDCCHDLSMGCHCAQLPALSMATLEFGEVAPAASPQVLPVTRQIDARGSDFFRPPI